MAKIILDKKFETKIATLEKAIIKLNSKKIKVLFKNLHIYPGNEAFKKLLEWELIAVTVLDRQMALQLNSYCSNIPNLKFVVDEDRVILSVVEEEKGRKVWKQKTVR